jgi:UDP-glucose 4-epimerase
MTDFNKKILVTGGAGFIGARTANALIEKGASVVVVDTLLPENQNAKAKYYQIAPGAKLDDIFEKEKPEIVYHFALGVGDHAFLKDSPMKVDDIISGINLLENCKKYQVKKIIFPSSGFLYGNATKIPTTEEEPLYPITPYMINKAILEDHLRFFKKAHGISYVILRYTTVYGPGQKKGAMSDYINKLASGNQAEIFGDGQKTRDYLYIDDAVSANLMALDLPDDYENPVFNVGIGKETTLNELYTAIAKLLGKEAKPTYLPDRPGEQARYCLDYSKIKTALGWQPAYSLEQGLEKRLKEEKLI